MPDTGLMDRALALVKAVPELHYQPTLSTTVHDEQAREAAAIKISAVAEPRAAEAVLIDGGTAHCYAGWVLILGGYRFVLAGPLETGFYERDGQGNRVVREIAAAAPLLGIPFEEAYDFLAGKGLFWDHNTIPMIEAWIAYFKGEIGKAELQSRLEEERSHA